MFVVKYNFISNDDADLLCATYDNFAAEATVKDAYENPVVYWPTIQGYAQTVIKDAVSLIRTDIIDDGWGSDIYVETVILCRLREGGAHELHCDNCKADGTPNHTPHRTHSAIVYLNEKFGGGEINFPYDKLQIQPRTGMLVAFDSGEDYPHYVYPVLWGKRYSMAIWFTDKVERALHGF